MFSSKGLFSAFQCPRRGECLLPACWFSHEDVVEPATTSAAEYDPFSAGVLDSPPPKRRKLEYPSHETISLTSTERTVTPPPTRKPDAKTNLSTDESSSLELKTNPWTNQIGRPSARLESKHVVTKPLPVQNGTPQLSDKTEDAKAGQLRPDIPSQMIADASKPASMQRPVTPPVTSTAKNQPTTDQIKQEVLRPRILATGPDWQSRDTLLKVLHKNIVSKNNSVIQRVKQGEKSMSVARLMPPEIITLALDEEIDLARKYGPGVYQNMMKQRIHAITKLDDEKWKALVIEKVLRVKRLSDQKNQNEMAVMQSAAGGQEKKVEVIPGFGLEQELQILRHLQQPLDKLHAYGYITKPPRDEDIMQAKATLKASDGWEKCDRCSSRFQVFPGRDENGDLASGGKCRYHWARAGTGLLNRLDHNTGGKEAKYGCCSQSVGSPGCTEAEVHVYSTKDPKRLASVWQWAEMPGKDGVLQPVSFDCEMCYTTLGMEVVRVTAVSWPHNATLLDVLVRPYGEILDLNTRFSGVSRKMYAEAPSYTSIAEINPGTLSKVDSPVVARQLLFDMLTPDTPLIGHAIENDLNTLRIIHPFVIDTVLLYPHRRGLPMRNSLRGLAFEHLDGRSIQTAADQGHDSKEDAIATGDLVTKAVRFKWANMRADGWKFVEGKLTKASEADSNL